MTAYKHCRLFLPTWWVGHHTSITWVLGRLSTVRESESLGSELIKLGIHHPRMKKKETITDDDDDCLYYYK